MGRDSQIEIQLWHTACREVLMFNRQITVLIIIGLALGLSGCGATTHDRDSIENDAAHPASNIKPEAADLPALTIPAGGQDETETDGVVSETDSVSVVKSDLASALGAPPDQIRIVEVITQSWGDQSLGCDARTGVFQAVPVPGYRILLSYGNELYRYHTDQHGHFVRCVEPGKPLGPIIDKQK
jgi:hypothetical protein